MNKFETRFFVSGKPIQQGSKTLMSRGGKSWMVDSRIKELKTWRNQIAFECQKHLPDTFHLLENVSIQITFFMGERAKNNYTKKGKPSSKYRHFPNKKPDIDKLTRAVLDALTGVVYADDAQVVSINAKKRFGPAGVLIHITSETPNLQETIEWN